MNDAPHASPILATDPIPATVDDEWFRTRIVLCGRSNYFKHKRAGRYAFLEVDPPAAGVTLYSGVKIARWLAGDGRTSARGFGRLSTRGPRPTKGAA